MAVQIMALLLFDPSPGTPKQQQSDKVMTTTDTITLIYEGRKTKLTLVDNKIQLAAVEHAFQLQGVELNGCIEPVDEKGFTYRTYQPSDTVEVAVQKGRWTGSTMQRMYEMLLQFRICHSKRCHGPRSSSCCNKTAGWNEINHCTSCGPCSHPCMTTTTFYVSREQKIGTKADICESFCVVGVFWLCQPPVPLAPPIVRYKLPLHFPAM